MLDVARSLSLHNALITREGSAAREAHAVPGETATPIKSNSIQTSCAGRAGRYILRLFGNRSINPPTGGPLISASGIIFLIPFPNASHKTAMRFDSRARIFSVISIALANPTIAGTFSVPDRMPFSWPPPTTSGFKMHDSRFKRRRTNNTPMPFGP